MFPFFRKLNYFKPHMQTFFIKKTHLADVSYDVLCLGISHWVFEAGHADPKDILNTLKNLLIPQSFFNNLYINSKSNFKLFQKCAQIVTTQGSLLAFSRDRISILYSRSSLPFVSETSSQIFP